jgi:ankyrin repeat protein
MAGWMRGLLAIFLVSFCTTHGATADEGIHPSYLSEPDFPGVKRAVEEGADINAKHIAGGSALHYVVTVSAQMGLTGLIIREKRIIKPGQWDATGHAEVAAYLVKKGADVNSKNTTGKTPLHVAALTGHSAAATFLLAQGAQINAVDADGKTALDWAKWSATDDAISELSQATGTRINARGVRKRADKVQAALIEHGAK